jgi:predicted NBD/HSP70 family sugar kinase
MTAEHRIAVLDIGGTRIKAGLFEGMKLVQTVETDTPAKEGAKALLKTAARSAGVLSSLLKLSASVQPDRSIQITGIMRYANENLPGYTGTHVQEYFSNTFHCFCAVMNDAYCAALGEGTCGAARGYTDYICITYGTGIGGGVFLDGQPYYGKGGSANLMIGGLLTHPELHDGKDPFAGSYERCASTTALVKALP